jgi:hypothetical protein
MDAAAKTVTVFAAAKAADEKAKNAKTASAKAKEKLLNLLILINSLQSVFKYC